MKINVTRAGLAVGLTIAATTGFAADQTAAQPNDPEKSYTGTITSINAQAHTLEAKSLLLSRQFALGNNCSFVLPGMSSADIHSLQPGEKIQISYQEADGVRAADRVELVPMRYEGMVKAIDPVQHTLTVRVNEFNRDLQIGTDCKVVLRNDRPGALSDIEPGDRVTVTYETPGDQPTAWKIEQTSQSFTGELVAFDLTDRTLKAREGFGTKDFSLGEQCAIVLNGKPVGKLEDLRPDERLVFNYDEVNGVNVLNRIAPVPARAANSAMTTMPGASGMGY